MKLESYYQYVGLCPQKLPTKFRRCDQQRKEIICTPIPLYQRSSLTLSRIQAYHFGAITLAAANHTLTCLMDAFGISKRHLICQGTQIINNNNIRLAIVISAKDVFVRVRRTRFSPVLHLIADGTVTGCCQRANDWLMKTILQIHIHTIPHQTRVYNNVFAFAFEFWHKGFSKIILQTL